MGHGVGAVHIVLRMPATRPTGRGMLYQCVSPTPTAEDGHDGVYAEASGPDVGPQGEGVDGGRREA